MMRRHVPGDTVICKRSMRSAIYVSVLAAVILALPLEATLAAVAAAPVARSIGRDKPVDSIEKILAAFDAGAGDEAARFRRIFGRLMPAKAPKASTAADDPENRIVILMAAGNDPRFEQWQKDANERLKQEAADTAFKQHPFAIAQPDKSVVVCEAGCLRPQDEIVYLANFVPAGLLVTSFDGSFDPSSTNGALVTAAQTLESSDLSCIAGCYGHSGRNSAGVGSSVERSIASAQPGPAGALLALSNDRSSAHQSARPPHDGALVDRIRSRLQIGHNGAIIEQQTSAYHGMPAADGRASTGNQRRQRALMGYARAREFNRTSMLRVGLQMRHHTIATAHVHLARRK